MAYRITKMLMTLSDLQGHSRIASLFKCDYSYSCVAVKYTTDTVHHEVL